MRKRFKIKRRTCALCKPSKRGWAPRWRDRDLMLLRDFEVERQRLLGRIEELEDLVADLEEELDPEGTVPFEPGPLT